MKTSGSKEPNLAQRYFLANWKPLLAKYRWAGDREDLRQSVLLKLHKYDDEYWTDHVKNLTAFVNTTIKNCANDEFRKNGKQYATDEDELNRLQETWLSQEKHILRDPTETYIETFSGQELVDGCTDDDRTLLELLYEGFTEKEIAAALGVSYEAVRKRSQRLRRKLRLRIDSGDKDPP